MNEINDLRDQIDFKEKEIKELETQLHKLLGEQRINAYYKSSDESAFYCVLTKAYEKHKQLIVDCVMIDIHTYYVSRVSPHLSYLLEDCKISTEEEFYKADKFVKYLNECLDEAEVEYYGKREEIITKCKKEYEY